MKLEKAGTHTGARVQAIIGRRSRMVRMMFFLLAVITAAGTSLAQDTPGFPNRPIRLVVPFVPGGTADTIARIVSDRLYVRLGRPIVLDTRAGANKIGRAHV